jgi:hypothetical protein
VPRLVIQLECSLQSFFFKLCRIGLHLTGLLLIVGIACGALFAFWPKNTPTPLVDQGDWRVEGQFFRFPLELASHLDIPKQFLQDKRLVLWRSWSPETEGTIGTVRTAPFQPSSFLAVPFHGFPAERPGNRIFLRCVQTNASLDVAVLRTNTQWATAYLHILTGFCVGEVELVATAADRSFYVGVGTPFAVDAVWFYAHSTFFPKLLVVLATWAVFCLLILAMGYCLSAYLQVDALTAGFIMVGVVGVIIFILFHFSPKWGSRFIWTVTIGAFCITVAIWLLDRGGLTLILRRAVPAALLWLAVSVAYAAFVSAPDNGGGSWAVNGIFTPLRWSSDNQIPFWFADALYHGVRRETISWGPWLASDRPPLLAALLLIPRSTLIPAMSIGIGTDFISTAYQLSAITILAIWSAALYRFCLRFGAGAGYVVFLAFVTSFFFFNTVYIWPKLLAAIYVLVAFGLLARMREKPTTPSANLALVALSSALAYLCHASSALAAIALAAVFAGTIRRRGFFQILMASLAGLACIAPWLWWQIFVQPGSNALIRFALTGDIRMVEHSNLPLMDSILHAYRELGFAGWVNAKLRGVALLLGVETDWRKFPEIELFSPAGNVVGASRVLDFYASARSLGMACFGIILLACRPLLGWPRPRDADVLWSATAVGVAAILLPFLVTLFEPFTHHEPYGALLLLFFAGAITLSSSVSVVKWGGLVIATVYFLFVWVIQPIEIALRLDESSLLTAFLAATVVAYLSFRDEIQRSY